MTIYLACEAQIALLKTNEAPITVLAKYLNFTNVFSKKYATILPKYIKINIYAIDLEEGKQPSYKLIYNLGLVELESLKTYIETNLANSFIRLSPSSTSASILFDRKHNGSLYFYVNYQSLYNLIIKN